jgi:hypothetical protein
MPPLALLPLIARRVGSTMGLYQLCYTHQEKQPP